MTESDAAFHDVEKFGHQYSGSILTDVHFSVKGEYSPAAEE